MSGKMIALLLCTSLGMAVSEEKPSESFLFQTLRDMEALYHQENKLLSLLNSFIKTQRSSLKVIERKYQQLKRAKPPEQSAEDYVSHPVNSYALIKRLVTDWPLVLNLMTEKTYIPEELSILPDEDDLKSAITGISRIQYVYNLDIEQLGNGIVESHSSVSTMTGFDCFEFGKYWYKNQVFTSAKSWFEEALKRISQGDATVHRNQVLPYLYLAITFTGCQKANETASTQGMLTQLLAESPDLVLNAELNHDFKLAMARNCSWISQHDLQLSEITTKSYSELCRGFVETPKDLKCHYVRYNNPRLLLAPFKLEEVFLEPPIALVHDAIFDEEIEIMKSFLFKNMSRCGYFQGDTVVQTSYRICDLSWVHDSKSKTAATLSRRVFDMTDLHGGSEPLQVAHYGLGGEYKIHVDTFPSENSLSPDYPLGNRVATLMFYLNDVSIGGHTIFPYLNVSVAPKKGTALFWFNIDQEGKQIFETAHAACPVVVGEKWVLNKWMREMNQDFEKLCPRNRPFPRKHLYL